jgi:hypothetical protein
LSIVQQGSVDLSPMMDPLSMAASIIAVLELSAIAVLELSAKVLAYLNDITDASSGRAQLAMEISNTHSLLTNLRFRIESSTGSLPWYTVVRTLTV